MDVEKFHSKVRRACVEQRPDHDSKVVVMSRPTLETQSSKFSSSNEPPERPPMRDISNKLHALVDAFVSNLSSECDSLANTVTGQAHRYRAPDRAPESTQSQRTSNRTAAEVLIGLKRPTDTPGTQPRRREGKSHVPPAKANLKNGLTRSRAGGRSSQDVEVLSSDHSSDDCPKPARKGSKKQLGTQRRHKGRKYNPRGSSPGYDRSSPVRSPEGSDFLDYSYEGDTQSVGDHIQDVEATFNKLRWPDHIENLAEDGGVVHSRDHDVVRKHKESQQNKVNSNPDFDIILPPGEEYNDDDIGHNSVGTDSETEELPVLPKIPVKRRAVNEGRANDRSTARGKTKSISPQIKKHKTPQIDASVITQLYFGRRPTNSVSMAIN